MPYIINHKDFKTTSRPGSFTFTKDLLDNDFSRVLIVIIKIASIVGEEAEISPCELCEIYGR